MLYIIQLLMNFLLSQKKLLHSDYLYKWLGFESLSLHLLFPFYTQAHIYRLVILVIFILLTQVRILTKVADETGVFSAVYLK